MSGAWGLRRVRVAAACVLQLVLVGVAVAPSLSARVLGEEYRLAVAPVDPIDPFRGAYVTLGYPGLDDVRSGSRSLTGTVFVPLERAGDLWEGGRAQAEPPSSGPYLRCASEGWRVRCGIESFFASQDRARELERELVDGAVARIRVDGSGNAAVVAIEPR
jgi:uncharacterized membrane-anchored protein